MTETVGRLGILVEGGQEFKPNGHGPGENGHAPGEPYDPLPLTDVGNGLRFARYHGADCRYCDPQSGWYIYDGARWQYDTTQAVVMRAKDVVLRILDEAREAQDEGRRAELAKHAIRTQNISRLQAMLKAAESELPIRPEQLDTDSDLFNVANGTLDLRTFELRPHAREDYITKISPVSYDPEATCPHWLAFITWAMAGSERKVNYIKRFLGYSLTGHTWERAIVFCVGLGANGKTVTANVAEYVFGDYAQPTQPETIMRREHKELSNDIAMLVGARFVPTIEVEEGARMAESLVKQLTGGDKVTARRLYADFFTFTPTFKIWIAGNHRPIIKGTDPAIWERIHVITFTETVPKDERDPRLLEKLKGEASGILNWILEGCREWRAGGLAPPEEVRIATDSYREEMDLLGAFLEERCLEEEGAWSYATDLYREYAGWCESARERPLSQTRFGLQLGQRGFVKDRETAARRRTIWRGVGVLARNSEGSEGLDPLTQESSREREEEKKTEIGVKPLQPFQEETF